MANALPPYNPRAKCAKCGSASEIRCRYERGIHHTGACRVPRELVVCKATGGDCTELEHMERHCSRCCFEWAEAVLS